MLRYRLHSALTAYNSPNRTHYPLNNTQVTNLDAVEHYLKQAISLAPQHFGLPLTIANMQTFRGNVTEALHGYLQCLNSATNDNERCQALTYIAVWNHYCENIAQTEYYLEQLQQINTEQANQVRSLLNSANAILTTPLCQQAEISKNALLQQTGAKHAVVIMGYVLNNDGSMAERLIQRLYVAKALAQQLPDSLLLVTGGLAKSGTTESQQMKRWLIAHGVAENRVIEESQAVNTIDNALFSLDILRDRQIQNATVVSASDHVHRSLILFEVLQWKLGKTHINFNHCAVSNGLVMTPEPDGKIRLNCYIDALRAYGLPAFNCEPFVQI